VLRGGTRERLPGLFETRFTPDEPEKSVRRLE
jgi:hypothetical protein